MVNCQRGSHKLFLPMMELFTEWFQWIKSYIYDSRLFMTPMFHKWYKYDFIHVIIISTHQCLITLSLYLSAPLLMFPLPLPYPNLQPPILHLSLSQRLLPILHLPPPPPTTLPLHPPGGPAVDPGEARAEPGGAEEAGGDPGVLAGTREHHPGQGPPAVWSQPGRPAGAELHQPGPSAAPAGGTTGLRGPGSGPD